MEKPIQMDDLGGKPTIFGNHHIVKNLQSLGPGWSIGVYIYRPYHFFGKPSPVEKKNIQGAKLFSPAQEDDFLPEDQMFKMPKNLSVQGWARFEKVKSSKVARKLQELCENNALWK